MPESFEKHFGRAQPRRSASRGRLFKINDEFAHRIPDRLRVSVLNGKWDRCALVGGEQCHAKSTGLAIWDQNAGEAMVFRIGEESAIHAADGAKVPTGCVAQFARHLRFLRAGFGLYGLCGLYRGLCASIRISGILRS